MIAVIVLTHDRVRLLERCVEDVLLRTSEATREIVIWNNASTDGTAEYLAGLDDPRLTIVNHDAGEKWVALQVADFGDGDAEVYECREGDTFDAEHRGQYVVRRTDNAGSLKWREAFGIGQ